VDLLSTTTTGTPVSRSVFRARVWRPALVRAGPLGGCDEQPGAGAVATWTGDAGQEVALTYDHVADAVADLVRYAGGPHFYDLRHAYATWLISDGVPVNVVQR
jgi:hypothetical protein